MKYIIDVIKNNFFLQGQELHSFESKEESEACDESVKVCETIWRCLILSGIIPHNFQISK